MSEWLRIGVLASVLLALFGCSDSGGNSADPMSPGGGGGGSGGMPPVVMEGACELPAGMEADFAARIGCRADFDALASLPLDQSIPGARSGKVVLDTQDGDKVYFQNSKKYAIHYEFASTHLSGNGLPFVDDLATFNTIQYSSPERRFILGAITYYEGPQTWTLEMAPYDTASSAMMTKLYEAVKSHTYFGPALAFHPTSESVAMEAAKAGAALPTVSTTELYRGIDYQPLNLGTVVGRLRFFSAAELASKYVDFQDIVVLDEIPNDITVVSGMITDEFQTPLSHVNVLAVNRKTPNMGLRGASQNPALRALEGQWVKFTVGAFEYSVVAATAEEAAADWEARRPKGVTLPPLNLDERALKNVEDIVDESSGTLLDALKTAILAYGAKTAHYAVLANTANVPVRKAFGVPIYYYVQFMQDNGFYDQIDQMLADPNFVNDPAVRDQRLKKLRDDMMLGTVSQELQDLLRAKLDTDFPKLSMRFRTSTNSEDLDGFPCAGCYESHTGKIDKATGELDWPDVLDALRETWASIWLFRTFEERRYHSIDHKSVGMGLLVHHNFPEEEANGVAITANPFDPLQLQPGFYVNVQFGGASEVVHPPPGITTDNFVYYFNEPMQPTTYTSHSNLVPDGQTVLTRRQIYDLGVALDAIHQRFSKAYGPGAGNHDWYAMDVEFKYDDEDSTPGDAKLIVKQARPYPGRGK
ncbi:MAG: PEP/pyruvate-binding domain-containing protein [Myxococcota bacterium]|nr:PEP/pyruvate-binding domain-containing protein [Myxococcota bacterium]